MLSLSGLILLTLIQGTFQTVITGPENKVAHIESGPVILNCVADSVSPLGPDWEDFTPLPITISRGVNSFRDNFTVIYNDTCGSYSCYDLSIDYPRLENGARYRCTQAAATPTQGLAYLIMLESDPVMSMSAPGGITLEGDTFSISCYMRYGFTGSADEINAWIPAVEWTGPHGSLGPGNPGDTHNPGTFVNWTLSIPVTRHLHGAEYTCGTYFRVVTPPDGEHASNVPDYTYNITSVALYVQFPPTVVNISVPADTGLSPNETTFFPGRTISCSAAARPDAVYTWSDLNSNDTTVGRNFVVPSYDEYGDNFYELVCGASNTFGSAESDVVTFVVIQGPTTVQMSTPGPTSNQMSTPSTGESDTTTSSPQTDAPDTGLSGGAIAGIVIGVVVFVLCLVFLVLFLKKKKLLCQIGTTESGYESAMSPEQSRVNSAQTTTTSDDPHDNSIPMQQPPASTTLETNPAPGGPYTKHGSPTPAGTSLTALGGSPAVVEPPPYTPKSQPMPKVEVESSREVTETGTRVSVAVTVET